MTTQIEEIAARVRRIETRLAAFLSAQGHDVYGFVPEYRNGALEIPDPNCSISKCVGAIPAIVARDSGAVPVLCDGVTIAYLTIPR